MGTASWEQHRFLKNASPVYCIFFVNFRSEICLFHERFFQVDERNEDLTEDNLILSEDLAEDCLSVQDVISCVNPERSNNLLYNLHVLATISFLSYNLLS